MAFAQQSTITVGGSCNPHRHPFGPKGKQSQIFENFFAGHKTAHTNTPTLHQTPIITTPSFTLSLSHTLLLSRCLT